MPLQQQSRHVQVPPLAPASLSVLSLRRRLFGAAVGLAGLCAITLALLGVGARADLSTALLAYLTLTLLVATIGGLWPSLPTAVAGFAAGNWFFTPPFRTWSVDHAQDILALGVFLIVAVVVSVLAGLVAQRAADSARAEILAEGNRTRTALLSAVSHDLRTPLATIKAWLTGLLEDDVTFSKQAINEMLTAAVGEVDRLNSLVGNLLDMSRLQTGAVQVHAQPVAIDAIASAAVESLPHHERVRIDIPDTLPHVATDPALLERIIANLIDNALRYSPDTTVVDVSACDLGTGIEVRVTDHGPGIPEQDRERILQPFQQLGDQQNNNGLGLGLTVAQGLSDALDANLRVDDTPNGGATMILRLQAAP